MRKVHCCHVPHEMWSRVLFFLLGMDIMRTSGRDGVAIICNITGKAHDKALRDLSDKDRQTPHNQRLFDARFGVQLIVNTTVSEKQPIIQASKGRMPRRRGHS